MARQFTIFGEEAAEEVLALGQDFGVFLITGLITLADEPAAFRQFVGCQVRELPEIGPGCHAVVFRNDVGQPAPPQALAVVAPAEQNGPLLVLLGVTPGATLGPAFANRLRERYRRLVEELVRTGGAIEKRWP